MPKAIFYLLKGDHIHIYIGVHGDLVITYPKPYSIYLRGTIHIYIYACIYIYIHSPKMVPCSWELRKIEVPEDLDSPLLRKLQELRKIIVPLK